MQYYLSAFSREDVSRWIERWMASYDANAYGLYALVLKQSGEVIGDCGHALQNVEGKQEIEIGYHVRRDLWGNGYATEAARACVAYGFETLCAPRLISLVRPENLPSRRVAEKAGMSVEGQTVRMGLLHFIYAISPAS
ncbi:MAG: GNAT family N-acetyltransferase, partial [Candidatus Acidiferrales bacterium]